MIQVPYCDVCKIPLTLKEKNGEKFFGCINYQTCKTKTQPYYGGLDEPRPARFSITEEMWKELNRKIDWLIDNHNVPKDVAF